MDPLKACFLLNLEVELELISNVNLDLDFKSNIANLSQLFQV